LIGIRRTCSWRTTKPTGVHAMPRFVEQAIPEHELSLMREALQRGQLTGNERFVNEVEQINGCRIERRRLERPRSRRR